MTELLESFENGLLTLTINRPQARNTLNETLKDALIDSTNRAASDPEVRCVALTGAGNIFSVGGDVGEQASGAHLGAGEADPEESSRALVKSIRSAMEISRNLHEMPKPSLAIINGAAAGAGLSLALACDMRFCLDTAKLTTAFSKVGLSGDNGGSYFLPQLVGAAKARELYFTADVITGQQAYELGLVTRVASIDTFEEESRAFANYLASLPTVAIGHIKQNLDAAQNKRLNEVFDLEAENIVRCMQTEDHQQAARAFLNKESVTFKGR